MANPEEEIVVDNGARKLSLDELGHTQPGMGRLMPEVGSRVWKLWYAAEARNWPLARYELEEAVSLMELGAFVRPKYERTMSRFLADDLAPVKQSIEDGDWAAFKAAFDGMIVAANAYHGVFNKGFIRWRLPDHPPPDLDLSPE
ncbi:MAG TPA: hypothetical protein VM121_07775 [Acidimicrobiales bacterium]|nr:hypothetical protein [Acidimicrobiales bacterium]